MKKITIKACLFAVALSIACLLQIAGSEVLATESAIEVDDYMVVPYDANTANTFIGQSAPELDGYSGWIFSGWYTTKDCTTAIRAAGVTTTCYAKFVKEEILSVKCQTKVVVDETDEVTEKSNLRFVSSIDSTNYLKVGFDISRDGKSYKNETNTSYKKIVASPEAGVTYNYSPKVIDTESQSFITYTITNIPKNYYETEFFVKPFWITLDGVKVYGVNRYASINDEKNSVVNIPVKVIANDSSYTASDFIVYESENTTAEPDVSVRYKTGEDYVNIILSGKNSLSSATKYCVYNNEDNLLTTHVHRNYDTAYANTIETADTSWYTVAKQVNSTEDEYVLVTSADLYGLAMLSTTSDFLNEKIYVVADIQVNEGVASAWGENSSTYAWTPIGSSTPFAGLFSGEGHTISGLYISSTLNNQALFGQTTKDSTIKDLKLANSYFASDKTVIAGISGLGGGTFDSIYVGEDVCISTTAQMAGGILGKATGDATIKNCWFAGTVTANDIEAGGMIGRVDATTTANVSYCLNTGAVYGGVTTTYDYARTGGMCGVVAGTGSLTLDNCLNVGNINKDFATPKSQTGSLVGYASGNLTIKDAYTTNESYTANETAIAVGAVGAGEVVGDYVLCAKSTLEGKSAYDTSLQFDDSKTTEYGDGHWVAMVSNTPVLKVFVESGAYHIADTRWYDKTKGTEDNPYILKTVAQLYGLAEIVNGGNNLVNTYIQLGNDIKINSGNAEDWNSTNVPVYIWDAPIGNSAENAFAGIFDGANYVIKGIYHSSGKTNVGLFAQLSSKAVVKNINVENSYISGYKAVAAIAGQGGKQFTNINVSKDVIVKATTNMCGGIIGKSAVDNQSFENCSVAAQISGAYEVGGIAGTIIAYANISNSYVTEEATITSTTTTNHGEVGGIVGDITSSSTNSTVIQYCLNEGSVKSNAIDDGESVFHDRAAGMCGVIGGSSFVTIENCMNVGTITGTKNTQIGSLIGFIGGSATVTMNESYGDKGAEELSCVGSGNLQTGSITQNDAMLSTEALTGENAYTNTWLEFDSPDKEALFDGHWVITDGTPMLRSFVEGEIQYPTSIKEDTRWYNSSETSFTICTAEELYGFAKLVNENTDNFSGDEVRLGANISVNFGEATKWGEGAPNYSWPMIGNASYKFAGTFNGVNHTIKGIYHSSNQTNVGIFKQLTEEAVIKNINVANSYISGNKAVAAIAGQGGKQFTNINVSKDVIVKATTNMCGGIIGKSAVDNQSFENCSVAAQISGAYEVGGIIGKLTKRADINNCYISDEASMISTTTTDTDGEVGGIIGDITPDTGYTYADPITIKYCLNEGTVKTTAPTTRDRAAGICGVIGGSSLITIENCLNVGTIIGTKNTQIGSLIGLIGSSATVTMNESYGDEATDGFKHVGGGTLQTGSIAQEDAMLSIDALTGNNAYTNTWLEYDSSDKEELFDGHWVITDGTPMLRSFVEGEIQYPSSIKNDIRWWDSEKTSFTIRTAEELYGFAYLVRANKDLFAGDTVNLGANIIVNSGEAVQWDEDKPNYSWSMIGTSANIFGGTFNGQNHTISGLYLSGTSSNVGLFAMTATSTVIQNISIANTYFKGKSAIGAIAGQGGGTFNTIHIGSDVYLENTVDWCGGIIGLIKTGSVTTGTTEEPSVSSDTHTIENCWFEGTIRTAQHGGGITGSVGKFENEGTTSAKRYVTNALIKNCLNTGTIIHTEGTTARAGGLVGAVVSTYDTSAQTATLISGLTIEDSFCAGSVYSEISGAGKMGAVVGHIFNGSDITCTDVYATRECNNASYVAVKEYVDLTNATVTRHFEEQLKGFSAYVNTPGLVYDNQYLSNAGNGTWVAVQNNYPMLKSFADGYTAVDFSPFVLDEATVITEMTDQGGGNASFIKDGDYSGDYIERIAGENGLGFTLCYSNSVGNDDKTVNVSSYKKDDLVITVTYVKGTDTTYISAGSNVGFSEYLTDNVSENETNGQMSLAMLELEKASGSSYVIQLKNGHFIIEDGGETENDYNNLVAYLKELAPNEKPIIDAWIISHAHVDHFGVMQYVNGSDLIVEGFYYTQASGDSSNAETIRNGAKLFQTTSGDVTEVYRMYTGQTYYFDGVTMEVLLTHEQLTDYTDFNETSVWCKYTIGSGDDAKIFLNGADADSMGMNFMMTAYSADYLYSDFFAALHHGVNILNSFKTYLANNTQANGYVAEHAILYSRQSNPDDKDEYLTSVETSGWYEEFAKDIAREQILTYNQALNNAVRAGIEGNTFFYYGAGTVRFDFTPTGITYDQ